MLVGKGRLYFIVTSSSVLGLMWLFWNNWQFNNAQSEKFDICLFKRVTGFPCPSCGTTRSLIQLLQLNFKGAFMCNPFGYILAIAILVFPLWVLLDLIVKKSSFYRFYSNFEIVVSRKWIAALLILLVASNWFWNILKFTS